MLCRRPQPQSLVDCRANIAGSVRRKPAATVSSSARSHLITDPEGSSARSPSSTAASITSISAPRAWPPCRTAEKAPALTAGASWQSGSKLEFGPSRSASRRAERFLVAFPTFLGLVHPRQRFAPLTGFGRNRLSLDHGAAPLGERTLGRAGQQPSSCPDYRKEISGNDMFRKVDVSGNE